MSMKQFTLEKRIADATFGASIGAAGGSVIATIIGFALPAISAVVPVVPLFGAAIGIVAKEIARRKGASANEE